jgi:hypothetical protein
VASLNLAHTSYYTWVGYVLVRAPCSALTTFRGRPNLVPLDGGSLLTLLALANQVSFLKIWDPQKPVQRTRNCPGGSVRYPSVAGEYECP